MTNPKVQNWIVRKPVARGRGGVVASQNMHAARAGAEMLKRGGNAIDAAITTAACMAALEPWNSGLGGIGFMVVYDAKQDGQKNVLRQVYEGVVGGLATVLENHRRDAVATKAELNGPVDDPEASTLEVVLRLLQNAFIKAILPGLDRERSRLAGRER